MTANFHCSLFKWRYNHNREKGPVCGLWGAETREEAMKDAIATVVLVLFAAVMLLFPRAWERLSEEEEREMFGSGQGA